MKDTKNKRNKKRRWFWAAVGILVLIGLWQLVASFYQEEEKQLRRQLRQTVKEKFPDQTARFNETFGLFLYEVERERTDQAVLERKSVVLIHGLDDPGKVWQNLAPALVEADFNVWLMRYPNDQRGVDRIFIVAHSMGGLVSREMLTSPEIEYNQSAQSSQVPEVGMLIMVGTPNHGSHLARFRAFAEVREQMARLTEGEANWLGAILDGAVF